MTLIRVSVQSASSRHYEFALIDERGLQLIPDSAVIHMSTTSSVRNVIGIPFTDGTVRLFEVPI